MTTAYSTLLGLALPVSGELNGTWGDTVNDYITKYVDAAIAGAQTLSTDANTTLTKTTGSALGATSSQYAILLCSGSRSAQRTITVPAASKVYLVINSTSGGYSVKVVGAGPTTGVTVANGKSALLAWNGSDFVVVASNDIPALVNVTGLLKGDGTTSLTAAVAGTDYVTPDGTETLTAKTLTTPVVNGYTEGTVVANVGSTYTIDISEAGLQILTLTASCTFTFPTPVAGKSFLLMLKQNGTGGYTPTYPGTVKWPGGNTPTQTQTAGKMDKVSFTSDGTYWYGTNAGQNY